MLRLTMAFTLYDLVSYTRKRNWANGHDNADGHDDDSWNCGWEGDDKTPTDVRELRKRQIKNFCCLLMLSNGTPMFRMGDEFMQTQHGNNNPYNQDNETTWLDWSQLEQHRDVFRFVCKMIEFRKRHPLYHEVVSGEMMSGGTVFSMLPICRSTCTAWRFVCMGHRSAT